MKSFTTDISLGRHRIHHVKNGSALGDAVNLKQLNDVTLTTEKSKTVTVLIPVGNENLANGQPIVVLNNLTYDIQVTRIESSLLGSSTPSATFSVNYGLPALLAASGDVITGIVQTTTPRNITSFDSAVILAGESLWVDLTAIAGNPTMFSVTVYYKIVSTSADFATLAPVVKTPFVAGSLSLGAFINATNIPYFQKFVSVFGSVGFNAFLSSVSAIQIELGNFLIFGNSGDTNVWVLPQNAQVLDGAFASVSLPAGQASTGLDAVSVAGLNMPSSGDITGIELYVVKKAGTTGIVDGAVQIIKDGIVQSAVNYADGITNWPTSTATVKYGAPNDLWGQSWGPADFGAGFGFEVSALNTGGVPITAYIDDMYVKVYFALDDNERQVSGSVSFGGFVNAHKDPASIGGEPPSSP